MLGGVLRVAVAPTARLASPSPTASVRVFGTDAALVRWPRGIALALLDALPPASARSRAW